jgi:molybdopterin molybdotransferase
MGLKSWQILAQDIAALGKPVTGTDVVSLRGSAGRILARAVIAKQPLPARTHAVMDGYALGAVPPGQYRLLAVKPERLALTESMVINAGESVPLGTASVVLADKASIQDGQLVVRHPQAKDNIRRAGEEFLADAEILKPGVQLDARHAALAAAAGVETLDVCLKPRVALLAVHDGAGALPHLAVFSALLTGDHLDLAEAVSIRSTMLEVQLQRLADRCDVIVVVAESLGGEDGLLAKAIRESGGEATIRRAALKPAKPVVSGVIGGTPVLGLAGTAYATTVAAHLFLRPLLRHCAGLSGDDPMIPAVAGFSRTREPGRAEALPVHAKRDGDRLVLSPAGRFGQLSALARMDGFALIGAESGDVLPGSAALYHPLLMPLV